MRVEHRVDVGLGRGVAEREAQRAAGAVGVGTHREQDVDGLATPARAGRARRALDPAGVEQHQQRVALAAGEGQVGDAGQPVGRPARPIEQLVQRRPVELASGTSATIPLTSRSRSAARRAARSARPATAADVATAGPTIAGDVERAGAHVALLAAAVQQRHALGVAAQQQGAGTHRAAELVPGHGQRVGPAGGEVDRHLADRLHRVGVEAGRRTRGRPRPARRCG